MEEIEELIERITDIKKALNEFEDFGRDCSCLEEDEFDYIFRTAEDAYDLLVIIKDYLCDIEFKIREKADD